MKIKSTSANTPRKKQFLIFLAITIVILAVVSAYAYALNGNLFGWTKKTDTVVPSINYKKPTDEQQKAGDQTKQTTTGSNQPSTPVPQPNKKSKVEMTITAANQNGSLLQLRSLILTVTDSGTCTLVLTKDGATITKTASVQALSSSSTCQGFDVSTSELSTGQWQANLTFENELFVGSVTKVVTVQ